MITVDFIQCGQFLEGNLPESLPISLFFSELLSMEMRTG